MTVIKEVENILKKANIEEARAEAKYIVKEISGLSLDEILLNENIPNKNKIIDIANKRAQTKKPVQYLLSCAYFMGEKYFVDENVLIPRDETELLVRCSFELLKNKKEKINILEIGIGSGCVSCELAKKLSNYDIEILGADISTDALKIALENISRHNLIRKIIVRKSDIFSKIRDVEKFDLILSNPPYIPIKQKEFLQQEVRFEPEIALFAPDEDGVDFYGKIIQDAPKFLKKNGFLIFESGIGQSDIIKKMLSNKFKNIQITKDLQNIERVISAELI